MLLRILKQAGFSFQTSTGKSHYKPEVSPGGDKVFKI
jgi:hypothetical protein